MKENVIGMRYCDMKVGLSYLVNDASNGYRKLISDNLFNMIYFFKVQSSELKLEIPYFYLLAQ